jgi:dihydrofolate reductase
MGKVICEFTMSLDGFIAGPNDDIGQLFAWYSSGDTPLPPLAGTDRVFRVSQQSARYISELWGSIGAMVTGRRDFDVSNAWSGQPPNNWPVFIVTHRPPQQWRGQGSPFTFVTDGVASAIQQAKRTAGDKHVIVGGATIIQQCLKAGLLDEIHIDLASLLLGDGISLFGQLGIEPVALERITVVEGAGVTHLRFRVVKEGSPSNYG